MVDVICRNPFHERHEAEPGWCARVGHQEGPESGTVQVEGLYCSACAPHLFAVRESTPMARKVAKNEAGLVAELAKITGLKPDEIAFLIDR